jgi:Flp pilus assembly protein TadD
VGGVAATPEAPGPAAKPFDPAAHLDAPGAKKSPDAAQQLAAHALEAFKKGDLAAAKRDFEKVHELVPGNPATTINLGLIEYRLGPKHYPEAERLLTRAVRAAPEAGLAWLILGIVQYEQQKLNAALASLSQAVLLEPKDARAHHYLGVTIGRKGWYSGAEEELRLALELDPNYGEAHFNLAIFYLQQVPPAIELARRHYQKALELGAAADPQIERSLAAPQ